MATTEINSPMEGFSDLGPLTIKTSRLYIVESVCSRSISFGVSVWTNARVACGTDPERIAQAVREMSAEGIRRQFGFSVDPSEISIYLNPISEEMIKDICFFAKTHGISE